MSKEQLPTLSGIKSQTAVLLGFVNKCLGLQAPVGFEHVKRNLNQVLSLCRFYRVSFFILKTKGNGRNGVLSFANTKESF